MVENWVSRTNRTGNVRRFSLGESGLIGCVIPANWDISAVQRRSITPYVRVFDGKIMKSSVEAKERCIYAYFRIYSEGKYSLKPYLRAFLVKC